MQRGTIGLLPRTPTLADESYLDFVKDVRIHFRHGMFPPMAKLVDSAVEKQTGKSGADAALKDINTICDAMPETRAWRRFMRSHQEMLWRQVRDGFECQRDQIVGKLNEAEKAVPERLSLDPNLMLPEYMHHEIHLQPHGYSGDDLAGMYYLYGTKAFYLGMNDQDELHQELVNTTKSPDDNIVKQVLSLPCGLGQATMLLKKRFPKADVIGMDASAPMLRHAHWRSVENNIVVNYAQGLAEDTGFSDDRFDIVLTYILFHELPIEVTKNVVQEVFRILRPGGEYSIFDFPTARKDLKASERFLIDYDHKYNCEPFSTEFVYSDFHAILEEAGFTVTPGASNMNGFLQTLVATKPANEL